MLLIWWYLAVNPLVALVALAVFITLTVPTKYVSLGFHWVGCYSGFFCLLFSMDPGNYPGICCGCNVIWAHRENINRLNAGSESKFSFGEKKKDN